MQACLMHYFGLKSTTDKPTVNVLPNNIEILTLADKKKVLYDHLKAVIKHYVIPKEYQIPHKRQML